MNHATQRYLHAKESIDERARSRRVRDRLLEELPDAPRIVEAGCGTGVTVSRLLEWGVRSGRYRGIDTDPGIVAHARAVRPKICRRQGTTVQASVEGWRADGLDCRVRVGDALARVGDQFDDAADLVVAQAFLDLVDLEDALAAFEAALAPGGLLYAPITFDGVSSFQPDHPADAAVERAYHAAIDAQPGRDSRAGRHLLDRLRGDLLAVDSSDWVVRPHRGTYPADERFFLARILAFVADALADADVAVGDDWLATRREQLAAGTLSYVAHQYDLLARL
jgi:SAM-dependent methyltransferase